MEPLSVLFEAKTINYKCNISLELIEIIPAIKIALTKFSEGKTQKYIYGGETSVKAIKLYLSWKKNKSEFVADPSLLDIDWKYVMFLAVHMADFDFFEDGPEFPSLEFMLQEIPNLPTEGLIPYLEQYLTDIFYQKVEWPSYKECIEALDHINLIQRRTTLYYEMYNEGNIQYKDTFEMVVTATRLVYDVLEPEILINMNFNVKKLNHANIDMDYYDQIMGKWSHIDKDVRKTVVYAYYDFDKFKIGTNFYHDWANFFTKQPILAKLIWNSMDRRELLAITNVSTKRCGTSAKLNFEKMQEYVQRFTPKDHVADPIEEKLRKDVICAKQGERIGRTGVYINSEEIAMAEAKLESYMANRKQRLQRKEAKSPSKSNTCTVITPKIQFNIHMCKQTGFKVHKL